MKTYKQFLEEALKSNVVKAAARQQYQSKAVQQKVAGGGMGGKRGSGSSPTRIGFNKVYHGTTQPASQSISRSGWRTDKNVTRQMSGSSVYATPQKSAAKMYADDRAVNRGEKPAVRTFSIPSSKYEKVKSNRQKTGKWSADKGGQKFNILQMTPQGANKYDITDKPRSQTIKPQGSQKSEMRQRVNTALQKPQNRAALRNQSGIKPRGGGSSAQGLGPSGSPSGTSRRYQVGGGQSYGLSGIKLAT